MGIRGSCSSKEELAEELADVVICVSLIAIAQDINLSDSIVKKFNKTSEKYGLKTRLGHAES